VIAQRVALPFALAIIFIGLLSIAFRLEKTAYRWASITLTIIVLIPPSAPAWTIALPKFIVALAVVALWPEHQPSAVKSAGE
jgi:predicted branched-subunit amino acid permease